MNHQIHDLSINGLTGRYLLYPSNIKQRRRILLIYGHHGMIERWMSLVENLHDYGEVTLPDLPGFGGMQSFRKAGQKINMNAYADYLADFIRQHYKNDKITIVAISFGFTVVARMLLRHPEIAKQVELSISLAGFNHYKDFSFSKRQRLGYAYTAWLISWRPISFVIKHLFLNHKALDRLYRWAPASKKRMSSMPADQAKRIIAMEAKIWRVNDMSTHWLTTSQFLRINNCVYDSVSTPTWHVTYSDDFYFNNDVVEQHMRQIFTDYHRVVSTAKDHTPSVVATKKQAAVMLPQEVRDLLAVGK